MANPNNLRQAMNGMDPRQRGLFAPAWTVGFVSRFAKGGAAALTLDGGTGEFGITYAKADYPQPWFDQNGGIYPVYHAIRGLAALRGQSLVNLEISTPREIQAIATAHGQGIELWLANLTDQIRTVELKPKLIGNISILSAPEFEQATQDRSEMDSLERGFTEDEVVLPPYAVARVRSL